MEGEVGVQHHRKEVLQQLQKLQWLLQQLLRPYWHAC
jgi:hypothetical protein